MNFRKSDTIVAVIGDHNLDKDYCGDTSEVMSREREDMAIFETSQVHYSGGGAANIVDLLQHWGVRVLPCGVWNPLQDSNSRELLNVWQAGYVNTQYMVEGAGTPAYVKYYTESGEHRWRANETVSLPEPAVQNELIRQIELLSKEPIDIVIVADYDEAGRGVLSNNVLHAIRDYIQCPKIGLSRKRIRQFKYYDYLILNKEELAAEIDDDDMQWITRLPKHNDRSDRVIDLGSFPLFLQTEARQILATLEGAGTAFYNWHGERDPEHNNITRTIINSQTQEGRINVCGCGDTFTAAFTICLASGMDAVEAIKRANAAARVQTRKLYGARTVDIDEWEAEYELLYSEVDNA